MLTNTKIIARQSAAAGGLEVLAQRHEIIFSDGQAVVLHPVQKNGTPRSMLLALQRTDGSLQLVDLMRLLHQFDHALRTTPTSDIHLLVSCLLRAKYACASSFVAAVQRCAYGTWWAVGNGHVWHAAARAIDPEVLAITTLASLQSHSIFGYLAARGLT